MTVGSISLELQFAFLPTTIAEPRADDRVDSTGDFDSFDVRLDSILLTFITQEVFGEVCFSLAELECKDNFFNTFDFSVDSVCFSCDNGLLGAVTVFLDVSLTLVSVGEDGFGSI